MRIPTFRATSLDLSLIYYCARKIFRVLIPCAALTLIFCALSYPGLSNMQQEEASETGRRRKVGHEPAAHGENTGIEDLSDLAVQLLGK